MREQNIPEGAEGKEEEAARAAELEGASRQSQALAAELKEISTAAERRWKIGAVVWAVICVVIFSYLLFIYKSVSDFLGAERLVYYGMAVVSGNLDTWKGQLITELEENADAYVDQAGAHLAGAMEKLPDWRQKSGDFLKDHAEGWLEQIDAQQLKEQLSAETDKLIEELKSDPETQLAKLDAALEDAKEQIRQQRTSLTAELKDNASKYVEEHIAPQLETLQEQLAETRERLVEGLKEKAPEAMDWLRRQATGQALPLVRRQIRSAADSAADQLAERTKENLDRLVDEVLTAHKENIRILIQTDPEQLAQVLEGAFEKQLGPTLSEYMEYVENALYRVRGELKDLVDAKAKGTLNKEQKLEYKLIQLWRRLVVSKLAEYEAAP